MGNLSWILSQTQQILLTRSIMRWMLFTGQSSITNLNIGAHCGLASILLIVYSVDL